MEYVLIIIVGGSMALLIAEAAKRILDKLEDIRCGLVDIEIELERKINRPGK